jgi:hypothetical protein
MSNRLEDNKFCPVCYAAFVKDVVKRSGGDSNVFIDVKRMTFRCRIPRYDHDPNGSPIVLLRDCTTGKDITYRQDEFQRKRRAGEL